MEYSTTYLVLAALFGLFMAWGIGANDVANAMATSVGSRALKLRTAIIIAAIFEFAGAFIAGGSVTSTIPGRGRSYHYHQERHDGFLAAGG